MKNLFNVFKRIFIMLLLFSGIMNLHAGSIYSSEFRYLNLCGNSPVDYSNIAAPYCFKVAPGAEQVSMVAGTAIPALIKFSCVNAIVSSRWFDWLGQNYHLQKGIGFKLIRSEKDEFGNTHSRYLQTFNGYPLYGVQFIVHEKGGYVTLMNGRAYNTLKASLRKNINEQQALALAVNYLKKNR